jgi:hypothetical protein
MKCRPYRVFGYFAVGHETANEIVPPHIGGDEKHVVNLTSNQKLFHPISLLPVVKTELLIIRAPYTIPPKKRIHMVNLVRSIDSLVRIWMISEAMDERLCHSEPFGKSSGHVPRRISLSHTSSPWTQILRPWLRMTYGLNSNQIVVTG